jgi:hypothetical protein
VYIFTHIAINPVIPQTGYAEKESSDALYLVKPGTPQKGHHKTEPSRKAFYW